MGKFTAKTNARGQVDIILSENAHLPHVRASWYDGGIGATGVAAILDGETCEQAALRAFESRIATKYRHTLKVTPAVWVD